MTTPLISITLPTFCCSGMRLLEGRIWATSEAPHQRPQSSEGPIRAVPVSRLLRELQQGRHTVGVVEASDVGANEGWHRHETHHIRLREDGSVTRGATGSGSPGGAECDSLRARRAAQTAV